MLQVNIPSAEDEVPIPPTVDEPSEETTGVLNPNIALSEALQLIREWVDSESLPQDIDRDVMSAFLQQLVTIKRIDKVQAMLRTLHR